MHWESLVQLLAAMLLSLVVGAERAFNAKAAGMRTTALVGMGSALFTLVSRHGIWLLDGGITQVDGSRVAAQIVSGVGFLGAGLIFVRRNSVRGLTTAASVWLVAAIGMACGAGLVDLAAATTAAYLIVVIGAPFLQERMPTARGIHDELWVTYEDGHGVLRAIMETTGQQGIAVENLSVVKVPIQEGDVRLQRIQMTVRTLGGSFNHLVHTLAEVPRVREVHSQRHHVDED